ncbi:MAG: hypothetical protein K1000chlam4_00887 [Chlamydiae bacterium]|nr:hypothetical protein [Chlamydiota bacterium]
MLTLTTLSSRVATGLTSLVLNFYHLGACRLARITGLFDAAYHDDIARYYAEQRSNAFYKLIGSKRRIVCLPSSSKMLVRTKNRPRDELNDKAAWQQVAEHALKLFQSHIISYVDFHPEKASSMEDGVCQGMVQVFIHEYNQARTQDFSFEEAAIKAAEPFSDGATLFACAIQRLHQIIEVNDDGFDLAYPKDQHSNLKRDLLHSTMTTNYGHIILGAKAWIVGVYDFSVARGLEALEDGVYDIIQGWTAIDDGRILRRGKIGHAIALLVHEKSFLIFDPNIGLFSHSEPDRFFEIITRTHDNEILIYTSLKY